MNDRASLTRAVAVLFALIGTSAADAGFFGGTVSANYYWPNLATVLYPSGTAAAGAAVEFPSVGGQVLSVDVTDTGFRITYPNGWNFNTITPKTFDGFVIADALGTISPITGVSIAATNIPGFDASKLAFDADHVYVNQLGYATFPAGSFIEVNVNFDVTAKAPPIFWRKSDGTNASWQFVGAGPSQLATAFLPGVPSTWLASGSGDVDGDGIADIVWFQPSSGQVAIWLMASASAITSTVFPANVGAASGWQLAAVGDVNGDGRADLVWRHASGQLVIWHMNASGAIADSRDYGVVPLEYELRGTGDFNGDGTEDLLWFRSGDGLVVQWLMATDGSFGGGFPGAVGPGSWRPERSGDFDGDGKSDIFWRNDADGTTAVWYLDGSAFAAFDFFVAVPPADWQSGSVADYDLDGRAELVWYGVTSGAVTRWRMNGRHAPVTTEALPAIGTGWQTVP